MLTLMTRLHSFKRTCIALTISITMMSLSPGWLPASAQQPNSVEKGALNLLLTVTDKNRVPVSTLRREDLRVLEDGRPREIGDFKWQPGQAFSLIVMLDMSMSQERVIPVAKQVSVDFVNLAVRPGKDSVGIISFTGEPKLEQELTGNPEEARRAIERVKFTPPSGYIPGVVVTGNPPRQPTGAMLQGSSAIWDSVAFAAEQFSAQASTSSCRALILITDGQDTSSRRKLNEAVEAAIKSGVVVYSIGIGDEYYNGTNKDDLRKISERTGGRAFFPEMVRDLRAAFQEIEQALHSQYSISLGPSGNKADGKLHKIKIELVNPELRRQGLVLSYQQAYYAGNN
jgi:Ca-activated chloride channel family protein